MTKPLPLIVLVFALALASAPHSQFRTPVPPSVAARTAAGQAVSVIVGVDATFVPEGGLDAAAVETQRATVIRATEDVMQRVANAGVQVGTRLDFLPFFTARVSASSLESLATTPGVTSIELNDLDRPTLLSSVPITNAPPAWTAGFTGTGWVVGIADTGIEKTHSFLAGKVVSEACYMNAGGAGAGTSTCPGGGTASVATGSGVPCSVAGDCEHGTHVAGIAAGANGTGGLNGVAPGAALVALQVFTRFDDSTNCGGAPPCALSYSSDQVLALNRIAALAGPGNANHVAAVNMSLGGGSYTSQATCDAANVSNGRKAAIDNLRSLGIAVVISSGNDSTPTALSSPGCISSAVSVGSITDAGAVSSFSNNAPFLSLYAPGSSIVSSVPGNGYANFNGTSMAAPHVAGAWAILKQAVAAASVTQVLSALQSTGASITDQRGGTPHPLINVNAARLALQGGGSGLPGAPPGFTAVVSGNTVSLSWGAATGAPTGYTLVGRLASSGPALGTLPVGNVTNFGLQAPDGVYYLSVVATNAAGAGPESAIVPVVVPALPVPPGTPRTLAASVAGNTVTFSWAAPSSGGGVLEYILVAGLTPGFTVPAATVPLGSAATSVAIPGVPAGTFYARVLARNAGGTSGPSNEVSWTVAGPAAPGAPVLNAPSVSGGVVSLSWSAGSGGTPTSYVLYASSTPGGAPFGSAPLTGNSVSVGGVASGTYYLRMTAVNGLGTSPLSNQVTLVVP